MKGFENVHGENEEHVGRIAEMIWLGIASNKDSRQL